MMDIYERFLGTSPRPGSISWRDARILKGFCDNLLLCRAVWCRQACSFAIVVHHGTGDGAQGLFLNQLLLSDASTASLVTYFPSTSWLEAWHERQSQPNGPMAVLQGHSCNTVATNIAALLFPQSKQNTCST